MTKTTVPPAGIWIPIGPLGTGDLTVQVGPGRTNSGGVSMKLGNGVGNVAFTDPSLKNTPNNGKAIFKPTTETHLYAVVKPGTSNTVDPSRAGAGGGTGGGPPPPPTTGLDPTVNTFSIQNVSPADVTDLPYTFKRVFKDGEIRDLPSIQGQALQQWTVLARYASGCVRRAVCQTVFPKLVKGVAGAFLFANTTAAQAAGPAVDPSDLLAKIVLTRSGKPLTADAKTMFDAGYATKIYDGPIATTFLIRDDSVARVYDMGFDKYRSARPAFLATKWHALGKWEVVPWLGNMLGGQLGDVACDKITITIGTDTYSEAPFVSYWGTWIARPPVWIGGAPVEEINFDHNLGWLATETKALPQYDPAFSRLWTEPVIAAKFKTWLNNPRKGLNEPGLFDPHMNDIEPGTDPPWHLDFLLSRGDWRMRKVMMDQTYRAGCFRINFIEGDPTLWFDQAKTVKALGKPPSIFSHPVEQIGHSGASSTFVPHDEGVPHVTYSLGWQAAHEPNAFAIPYLLTGNPLLLEAMQRWAMCDQMSVSVNPTPTQKPYFLTGLRAAGIGGYGSSSTRGCARSKNVLVSAYGLSTDNTPEKDYLKVLCDARFGVDFGVRGYPSPEYGSTPAYQYGVIARNSVKDGAAKFSPMGWWQMANMVTGAAIAFKGGATWAHEPWQNDEMLLADGRARDNGFAVQVEIDAISQPIKAFFAESQADPVAVDPKLFGTYVLSFAPGIAVNPTAPMFTTHAQSYSDLVAAQKAMVALQFSAGASHYVPWTAAAAAVFCKKNDPLWQWIMANVRNNSRWDHVYLNEPHFCVSPRT